MDPLRIAVRVLFIYVVLRVFVRIAGKRSVKQASPFDFVLALILGDMMDDAIWAEVGAATFVVASGVLVLTHIAFELKTFLGSRAQ